MQNLRKVDPTFVNFAPSTAEEAVDRFVRCRRNGLKPYLIPEFLIACAASLPAEEEDVYSEEDSTTGMTDPSSDSGSTGMTDSGPGRCLPGGGGPRRFRCRDRGRAGRRPSRA